jgi:hypothetical protein
MAQVSNLFTGEEQRNADTAARIRAPPVTQTFRILLQPGLVQVCLSAGTAQPSRSLCGDAELVRQAFAAD